MEKIKSFIIAIIVMMFTTIISLFVVSTLTYIFKWQADKAMMGIIATYIVAGFAGGFCMRCIKKKEYGNEKTKMGQKVTEALLLSGIFMLLLLVVSFFVIQNPFEISNRFLMILLLLNSSCFLGRIL